MEERASMYQLERDVRQAVRDEAEYLREEVYPEDTLHDIAEAFIPIYNYDLAQLLAEDTSLAEPEDTGLVEGQMNVFTRIMAAVYERLYAAASEEWEEVKSEEE